MCLEAVMHTGEDCEETESNDYVGGALWLSSATLETLREAFRRSAAHVCKTGGWETKRSCFHKLFMLSQSDPRVFCVIVLQVSETIYFSGVAAGSWSPPD